MGCGSYIRCLSGRVVDTTGVRVGVWTLKNLTPHHPVTINAEMSRTAQDQRGGHSKLIGEHQEESPGVAGRTD